MLKNPPEALLRGGFSFRESISHPLLRALALSVVVHALLLSSWQLSDFFSGSRRGTVEASLRKRVAPSPREFSGPLSPLQRSAGQRNKKSPLPTVAGPRGANLPEASPSSGESERTRRALERESPLPVLTTNSVSRDASEPAASDRPTESDLRRYRLALAREARRFKHYPAVAKERSWEGSVILEIRLRPGIDPEVVLVKGSGYAVLDDQALVLMSRVCRSVTLPNELLGRHASFDLSIRYTLDD